MKRAAVALALAGCAAGPALKDYPRAAIDRPYTLPQGVATWGTSVNVVAGSDDSGASAAYLNIPLQWNVALSDEWGLLLGDSLGVRHAFFDRGGEWLGAALSLRPGVSSEGALLAPSFRLDHRLRLSPRWAFGSALLANASRWTGRPRWTWGVGAAAGPLLQVSDTLALELSALVFVARSYLTLPGTPIESSGKLESSVSLGGGWSVGRQWDLGAALGVERTSHAGGYREVWASLSVTNFW